MISDVESTPYLADMNAEALRELAAGLLGQLAQKDETIKIKQLKIDQLTHEMGILKRWRFGRSSEQLESGQRSLLEESIDEDLEAIGIELEALQEPAADRQQKQSPVALHCPDIFSVARFTTSRNRPSAAAAARSSASGRT